MYNPSNMTHFDVADFFESPKEKLGVNKEVTNTSFNYDNVQN